MMILRSFTRGLLRSSRMSTRPHVDIAVCIDIECTCDSPVQIAPMEVIEIACLKLDLTEEPKRITPLEGPSVIHSCLETCPTFHSYVKPVINPELTLFCQDLTGLLQSTVDKADRIDKVIDKLLDWLKEENLIDENYEKISKFAFASCGNFDLKLLSPLVGKYKFNDNPPSYFTEWINVKKSFVHHKSLWPKGLYHMLDILDQEPIGRLHSAIDDCKNLARVVECLHAEGCRFTSTTKSA